MKGKDTRACYVCGGTMELTTSSTTFNLLGKEIEIRGISWNSAMVEVFPSNNVDTYYFRAMEKRLFDQYESDEAFISEKVAELQKQLDEINSKGLSDVERANKATEDALKAMESNNFGVAKDILIKGQLDAEEAANDLIEGQ